MKFRQPILVLVLIFISFSFKNNNFTLVQQLRKKVIITEYAFLLKNWTNCYQINIHKFRFVKEQDLPGLECKLDSFNPENDIYASFYKPSPEQDLLLDMISYNLLLEKKSKNQWICNGESVDSEVSIKDLKNKIWKRILFVGSDTKIDDGFWINNKQLLIVGFEWVNHKKYRPVIWLIDLEKNKSRLFRYSSVINTYSCDYRKTVRYPNIVFKS